ncbi:MAG: c-type cytochrome [Rhodobacteraceae bacterium]|nr:c-type cytochrome [Paracoccaceae bacterium]
MVPRTAAEAARIAAVLSPPADVARPEPFEARPGGAATVPRMETADAFSQPSASLSFAQEMDFKLGNGLFRKLWVSAPSSTQASDGLGPLYNARACQNCHVKDGRGVLPASGGKAVGLFLRISVPAPDDAAMTAIEAYLAALDGTVPRDRPHPVYGDQLQNFSTAGQRAEAEPAVTWAEEPVTLAGGEVVRLRRPTWRAEAPGFGPLGPEAMLSPRLAPQMIGLGLLEAIPAAEILAREDPQDADGDGISGRANIVWSEEFGQPMLGRFGWKAGAPTVRAQSAGAFAGDMGLSTWLHPEPWGDCTAAQADCRAAPDGAGEEGVEVDRASLDLVAFYARNLGVPARRGVEDPEVLRGKALFHRAQCAACHTPKHVTHRLADRPEHSFQLIWPYTDLLLHDMGEGLADHRPEGRATGREWRTPPLWGIGLTAQVSGRAAFLHDGRARSLAEAILWHGGEGQGARDAFAAMPPEDRAALIRFLESL